MADTSATNTPCDELAKYKTLTKNIWSVNLTWYYLFLVNNSKLSLDIKKCMYSLKCLAIRWKIHTQKDTSGYKLYIIYSLNMDTNICKLDSFNTLFALSTKDMLTLENNYKFLKRKLYYSIQIFP